MVRRPGPSSLQYAAAEAADKTIDEGINTVDAALIKATGECVYILTVVVEENGMDTINVLLPEVEFEKRAEL